MRSESLDATGSDGSILRVEFLWRSDRFGHVISAVIRGHPIVLLESFEGTPADDWPPSPPLQSLHRELLPDGRTALLLVGAAGRSHWSASVEAAPREPRLIFDIACRHDGIGAWLGSKYTAKTDVTARLVVHCDRGNCNCNSEGLLIEPVNESPSLTARWRFSFALKA